MANGIQQCGAADDYRLLKKNFRRFFRTGSAKQLFGPSRETDRVSLGCVLSFRFTFSRLSSANAYVNRSSSTVYLLRRWVRRLKAETNAM